MTAGHRDAELLQASRWRYAELGLPRSEEKSFDFSTKFAAWGPEVDSSSGRCGAPGCRRKQLFFLVALVLASRKWSKQLLQSLVGSFVHPFCHRRELFSTLGSIFVWIQGLPENQVVKLPHFTVKELWLAALQLPWQLPTCGRRSPPGFPVAMLLLCRWGPWKLWSAGSWLPPCIAILKAKGSTLA